MRKYLLLFLVITLFAGCGIPGVFKEPRMSIIYDADGRVVNGLHRQNRIDVPLNEVSANFQKAIISAEDRHFYSHHGVDLGGILRALYHNIRGGTMEGGSTITQQTAKNLYLGPEKTLTRKIKELYYTFQLERRYSKDEILEMYVNTIYFGEGAYGIEAASRAYFGKNAADLTLNEASLLAGIPRRPGYYDPYVNLQAARARQSWVLSRMVEDGKITEAERQAAMKEPVRLKRGRSAAGDAPYFVDMVASYLRSKYGDREVYQGGLRVFTTLDLDMQRAAQEAFDKGMADRPADLQGALVAVDPATGAVRALIGGRDYVKYPYNRAVKSYRQPGSAFKPFLYSLALQDGYTEASMFMCEYVEFQNADGSLYTPKDYGDTPYHDRPFTLKEALMVSDNVVAVRLMNEVGPDRVAAYAKKFGFKGSIRPYLALALGTSEVTPMEMAGALATFANQGVMNPPYFIERVEDSQGNILESASRHPQRILTPQYAYLITDMMKSVFLPGGTASSLAAIVARPAAGKTGTTQEYSDAWFVGFTPQISCAVWVGYDDPRRSVGAPGGRVAGPIWANFVREALARYPETDFAIPTGITTVPVCLDTGTLAGEDCERQMSMAFISGTEPREVNWDSLLERWGLKPREEKKNPSPSPENPSWRRWFKRLWSTGA